MKEDIAATRDKKDGVVANVGGYTALAGIAAFCIGTPVAILGDLWLDTSSATFKLGMSGVYLGLFAFSIGIIFFIIGEKIDEKAKP